MPEEGGWTRRRKRGFESPAPPLLQTAVADHDKSVERERERSRDEHRENIQFRAFLAARALKFLRLPLKI